MAWNSCAKRGVVGLGVLEWKTQIITKGMLGFFCTLFNYRVHTEKKEKWKGKN